MNGATRLPVLVEEDVWDEFATVIDAYDGRFTASSGRTYILERTGRRLRVDLVLDELRAQPSGDEIDADLFQFACEIQDTVPGEWSSANLRRVAGVWGWAPPAD